MTIASAAPLGWDGLADLFNRTRAGYIVPMALTADRLRDYARAYDLSLDRSFAAFDDRGQPVGLAMLGLRPGRAWITRLGVLPSQRGRGTARRLVETLIDAARGTGAGVVQLEYIVGNDAAGRLFSSFGFRDLRGLTVLERTADASPPPAAGVDVAALAPDEVAAALAARAGRASWVDDSQSLLNYGDLHGLRVRAQADAAWLIYRRTPAGFSHAVFGPRVGANTAAALIAAMHAGAPALPAQIENVPDDSPLLPALHDAGYTVAFRRREMALTAL